MSVLASYNSAVVQYTNPLARDVDGHTQQQQQEVENKSNSIPNNNNGHKENDEVPTDTSDYAASAELVTSHLSPNLRQRLSHSAARGAAVVATAAASHYSSSTGGGGSSSGRATNHQCYQHQRTLSSNPADSGRDEDVCVEVTLDSAASSTNSIQWRRNNPYAPSLAQSPQQDDQQAPFTTNVPFATNGAIRSPPQVNVVLHTGSNRVSRQTSIVKSGAAAAATSDARVSRTTSIVKTSDNSVLFSPQLAYGTSSLPGSARVSRQTSIVKGNESTVFPIQNLRFASSQPGSTPVSRTTSMVKGGNTNFDSIPIISSLLQYQHQPSHTQQQQVPALSPLMNTSPQSSQQNLLSPNALSTGDSQCSSLSKRVNGSGTQMPDGDYHNNSGGGDADGSIVGSPDAFLHSYPFRFQSSASGSLMSTYSRAELYSNDLIDCDITNARSNCIYNNSNGGVVHKDNASNNSNAQRNEGVFELKRERRPSFSYHSAQQQHHNYPSQQQHTPERRHSGDCGSDQSAHISERESAQINAGATVPIHTPLTSCCGPTAQSAFAAARVCTPARRQCPSQQKSEQQQQQHPHVQHEQIGYEAPELEEDDNDGNYNGTHLRASETKVFNQSLDECADYTQKKEPLHSLAPPSYPRSAKTVAANTTQQRTPLMSSQEDAGVLEGDGDAVEAIDNDDDPQMYVDPTPNPLLRTQPPHGVSQTDGEEGNESGESVAAADVYLTDNTTAHCHGFSVGELIAGLEAAHKGAAELGKGSLPGGEVWCPPGSQFSVYDAGMKRHYLIPSEEVALTRGAVKYAVLYERYGNQTRFRFQLCNRYLHNRCKCGAECQYIHSHVLSESTQVHVNENSITAIGVRQMNPAELAGGRNSLNYPTMDRGMVFTVFPPNQLNTVPQLIPSEMILVTEGALLTYRAQAGGDTEVQSGNNHQNNNNNNPHALYPQQLHVPAGTAGGNTNVSIARPRHCAHFQFKRMCNLGATCHFIHSLIPFVQGMVNQPPLPVAINPAVLDEHSAGFVLPKLPPNCDLTADANRRNTSVPLTSATSTNLTSNMDCNSSNNSGSATMAPMSSAALPERWRKPTSHPAGTTATAITESSTVSTGGDTPAAKSSVLSAHYPNTVVGKVPMTTVGAAAMYGLDATNTPSYSAWRAPGFAPSGHPYCLTSPAAMGAMGRFGAPSSYPQQILEQQRQRNFVGAGMGEYHPTGSLPPQPYAAYTNPSLQTQDVQQPQEPWPAINQQYF